MKKKHALKLQEALHSYIWNEYMTKPLTYACMREDISRCEL